jgi:asparagine synthase (glutamine-hydrolysing)
MSGIAGVYRFDGGSVEADKVAAMTEAIDHRGPDGEWTWRDGRVGLGHQRFETTPEAQHAGSPSERNGCVITFDGRIDNREELFSTLDVAGPPGRVADADLVLAAHERWGEDCPERLVGAYAFAIRRPNEERLFVARDHMGLRPFYYYRGEDRFLFGSEIKALWAAGGVPRRPDEIRLLNHLTRQYQSHERTYFEEVKRLPPAHVLVADDDGVETTEYWTLDPERTIDLETDEAYAERFRELFFEAVECRLRAKGPIGSMLSGGLDSSSIVCTADELRGDGDSGRLYTYSAVFDEEELSSSDEREYIDAVLEECSATPRFFRGDQRNPLGDLETILYHSEMPELGNNFYLHWNVHRAAGEDGVRVLLDGTGGDQVVSHGRGYLPELAASGRWLTLASEIRALVEKPKYSFDPRNILWERMLAPLLPSAVRKGAMKVWNDEFKDVVNPALSPEFLERTDASERLFDSVAAKPATVREQHHRQMRSSLVVSVLERLNKTTKAFGLEPRYPFFDRRLMEFCLAVPADQKMQQGLTRHILRNAMEGVLPREVQGRPGKGNLAPSFWGALREYADDDVADVLLEDDPQMAQYVDLERVRSGYREFVDGKNPGLETVWDPVVLEAWLRSNGGRTVQ